MMISQVEDNMPAWEFDLWIDWFKLKEEIRKKEESKLKNQTAPSQRKRLGR